MPTITLPYTTFTDPADKAEVVANDNALLAGLNGGLDNANLSGTAGITNANLANSHYETLALLEVRADSDGATHAAPATSATVPAAIIGIPGSATDGIDYTVASGNYILTGAGSGGNTTYKVSWGYYAAGAWVETTEIVASTNIAGGTERVSGALTMANSTMALSNSQQRFLALFVTAIGTNALDGQGENLSLTFKLRRTAGLRSA